MTQALPADLALGRSLAARFVDAGQGRVRRVSMIGSRARGTATADSDLDLVVVVELPWGPRPWVTADARAERRRLQEAVGPPPVRTDLWVCTTDLFEEGRYVVGGVESLVEVEGVDLYARAYDHPPTTRRSRAQVARANVRGWLEQGLAAYRDAARDCAGSHAAAASWKSARATINAALVAYQIRSAKHDPLAAVLTRLTPHEPELADWLRRALPAQSASPATARAILEVVVGRLSRQPALGPLVLPVLQHL